MKTVTSFVLLVCTSYILAQDTYWKSYDMSGDGSEVPYDMEIRNDTVYIWARGTCEDYFCMQYYQLNKEGEVLLNRSYPNIVPGRRVAFQDSFFYLPIRFEDTASLDYDGFRLGKFNLAGDLVQSKKYTLDDFDNSPDFDADFYVSYGSIKYGDKIVLYGEVVDEQLDDEKWQTCMFWYNESDLSLDTIIFVNPKEDVIDTWDAAIDTNGLLTLLIEYREEIPGPQDDFLVYVKYDESGNLVEFWDGPEWSGRFVHNTLLITKDNEVVMNYNNSAVNVGVELVRKIDDRGVIIADEPLGMNSVRISSFTYGGLHEMPDGNLIGCGNAHSAIAEFDGAYIFMLDKYSGEVLWHRAYLDWTGGEVRGWSTTNHIFLLNVGQFSDGTIFACGVRAKTVEGNSQNDLIILHLDEEGCIEPGCGGLKQNLIGEPAYDYMMSPESHWYYHDQAEDGRVIKYSIDYFDIGFDTSFLHLWTDRHLDVRYDESYENIVDDVFRIKKKGKEVYYIEDGVNELLYDFNLEVGDLFVSDYVDQPLEVIESDTIMLSDRSKMRYWTLACTENPENTIVWYEKMGAYEGVLWPRDFCSGDYGDWRLACYYRYERFAHMNPEVSDCFLPTSTSDESDLLALTAITAYPNPTQDHVTLTAPPDLLIDRLELLDTQGRTHNSFYENSSEVRLDLSGYPSGLYFVSIYTEKGRVVKKVVVE